MVGNTDCHIHSGYVDRVMILNSGNCVLHIGSTAVALLDEALHTPSRLLVIKRPMSRARCTTSRRAGYLL